MAKAGQQDAAGRDATKQADQDGGKPGHAGKQAADPADMSGAVKPTESQPASATSVQHAEPEDAYLTGGQRNLQRRVLGLNVEGNGGHRPADQSPGLHSSGSFTGTANGETERKKDSE